MHCLHHCISRNLSTVSVTNTVSSSRECHNVFEIIVAYYVSSISAVGVGIGKLRFPYNFLQIQYYQNDVLAQKNEMYTHVCVCVCVCVCARARAGPGEKICAHMSI